MSLRRPVAPVAITAVLTLALAAFLAPLPAHAGGGNKWELLGARQVTDKVDHDTIPVTAKEGKFTKLQLKVIGAAVQFRSMKVNFGNGEVQNVELKDVIQPGKTSRVIDVQGAERTIKSVDFVYDAQTLGQKGATVRLLGKH